MNKATNTALYILCIMILACGCTSSGIAPTATQEEPLPEDIGITSFFFSVNPATVVQGQCATVRWDVEPEGDWPVVFNNEEVGHVDQREVCPERTQVYELYADPPGPDIHEEIITLEVIQPGSGEVDYQGEGEILAFRADPERVQRGECAELTWEALAPPNLYFILNGEPVPPSGVREACPLADTVYELMLVEPEERIYSHLQISVEQPAGTAQDATPSSSAPTQATSETPSASSPAQTEPAWPTPTAMSGPSFEGLPRILDIFLARMPVGEVQVRIKRWDAHYGLGNMDETAPGVDGIYWVWLRCEATVYQSDRSPTFYSGAQQVIAWAEGEDARVYTAFPQSSRAGGAIDFTDSWGDVTCRLIHNSSTMHRYSERLP
ncbi:MAG: hypothetical protein PVI78_08570 [Anaerolineales bacterium]|jgi:hypothetical protein